MNRFVRRLVVAMLLGVAVYATFALYAGVSTMRASLSTFRWSSLVIALALSSTNYLIRFLKWQYYLARLEVVGIPAFDSLLVFLSGFVLTVTPGKVGEVFKSAVLSKTHGVPVARTAPVVVAERLTDVIGVVALIILGSSAFTGGSLWALAGSAAVGVGLTLILWERPVRHVFGILEARGGRLARFVPKFSEAYGSLRVVAGPSALLFPAALSTLAWACEGLAMWVILNGFDAHVSPPRALFFYSTATLAGALVPVPGGLGIVEGMIREQLVRLGQIGMGPATAAMILIRFATLWWAVVVGFGALFLLRLRYPNQLGRARELES